MRKQKLIEVFEDPFTSGIFSSLQMLNVPWKCEEIASELDLAFMTSYGGRIPSPLVNHLKDPTTDKLTPAKQKLLASTCFHLNRENWAREYATLFFDYDPIQNYSMIEKHTGTDTETDTPDDWATTETQTPSNWKETRSEGVGQDGYSETQTQTPTNWKESRTEGVGQDGYSETETQTPTNWKESRTEGVGQDGYSETETQTPTNWKETTSGLQADNEADASNSVYAFNSASPVKVSESESKVSSKSDVERTGTYETKLEIDGSKEIETERTGTYETKKEIEGSREIETERTGTYETKTEQSGTMERKTEYNTELTRSGNIGVTTSQQMIESERNLYLWNFFQNIVFKDLAKMMTLSIY